MFFIIFLYRVTSEYRVIIILIIFLFIFTYFVIVFSLERKQKSHLKPYILFAFLLPVFATIVFFAVLKKVPSLPIEEDSQLKYGK